MLEPRMVFDGAAAPTADAAAPEPPPAAKSAASSDPQTDAGKGGASNGTDPQSSGNTQTGQTPAANNAQPGAEQEHMLDGSRAPGAGEVIVFVDATVEAQDTLLREIPTNVQVVRLDGQRDGLLQIATYLKGHRDVASIQIISHGNIAEMHLGNTVYTNDSLGRYSESLAQIGSALARDGDILIFGCDVGADAKGEQFISAFANLTGADVAASTDPTGAEDLGGDWELEYHSGTVDSFIAISERAQADYAHLLDAPATTGSGALLATVGKQIYSVDIATGKATSLTTVPALVGGVSTGTGQNSLAIDHTRGLIYYAAEGSSSALFAYDYINNAHILIDSNLTDNGVAVGTSGISSGGATFGNGALYIGVENNFDSTDGNPDLDQGTVYRINLAADGRSVLAGASGASVIARVPGNTFGDIAINTAGTELLLQNTSQMSRYNLSTGALIATVSTVAGQAGGDVNGGYYSVGTTLQQINQTTGATIGTSVAITTNGTTPIGTVNDAAGWAPATARIGDKVFDDNNSSGTFDAGDTGLAGVTVQLIDDVDNDGVADAGERVLATDTTSASGDYLFTNVLPGNYLVRITSGIPSGATSTTGGTLRDADVTSIGGSNLAADFGFVLAPPTIDLNSTPAVTDIIRNGALTSPLSAADWTTTGSTLTSGGTIGWQVDNGNGTATQSGLTGLSSGLAPSGAAQLVVAVSWNNINSTSGVGDSLNPATLDISVGGVVYARVTTGVGNLTGTVTYLNGAAGSPATLTGTTSPASAASFSDITINLPTNVANSGALAFSFSSSASGLSGDDIYIDNVRLRTLADATAGRDWSGAYTENGTPVSIADTDSSIADADSANMASATIVLSNAQAGDRLRIGGAAGTILSNGATGTINGLAYTVVDTGSSITIQLTGSATRAVYADTIESIFFESTSDNPSSTPRTVNVTVSDGNLSSNTAVTTISVTPVNDAPAGADATLAINEDATHTFTVANFGFSDAAEGNAFSGVVVTTLPANGTMLLNGAPLSAGTFITAAQIAGGLLT